MQSALAWAPSGRDPPIISPVGIALREVIWLPDGKYDAVYRMIERYLGGTENTIPCYHLDGALPFPFSYTKMDLNSGEDLVLTQEPIYAYIGIVFDTGQVMQRVSVTLPFGYTSQERAASHVAAVLASHGPFRNALELAEEMGQTAVEVMDTVNVEFYAWEHVSALLTT